MIGFIVTFLTLVLHWVIGKGYGWMWKYALLVDAIWSAWFIYLGQYGALPIQAAFVWIHIQALLGGSYRLWWSRHTNNLDWQYVTASQELSERDSHEDRECEA